MVIRIDVLLMFNKICIDFEKIIIYRRYIKSWYRLKFLIVVYKCCDWFFWEGVLVMLVVNINIKCLVFVIMGV